MRTLGEIQKEAKEVGKNWGEIQQARDGRRRES